MIKRNLKNNKKSVKPKKPTFIGKIQSIKFGSKKPKRLRKESNNKAGQSKLTKQHKPTKKRKSKLLIPSLLIIGAIILSVGFIYRDKLTNGGFYSFHKASGDNIKTIPLQEQNYRMLFLVLEKVDEDRSFINELYISQVDYDNSRIKFIALPEISRILPSNGDPVVPIRNLYNLGAQKEPRKDIGYTVSELENYFGIGINRYFVITDSNHGLNYDLIKIPEGDSNIDEDLGSRTKGFIEYLQNRFKKETGIISAVREYNSSQGIKSNLSKDEAERFLNLIRSKDLKTDFNIFGELELEEKTDEFGNYEMINKELSDEKIRNYFEDVNIKKEQARIEVYNASGARLLGNKWSRVFKNSSLDVTRVGTAKEADKTRIYVSNPDLIYNLARVKSVLRVNVEVIENEKPEFVTTGDIIVVIGKDILNN